MAWAHLKGLEMLTLNLIDHAIICTMHTESDSHNDACLNADYK